jgi:Ca2+-binding EF-hand superfamily protein
MSRLGSLLDRLRTHLSLNGIHPVDWYENFDKLRSGRVTIEQFRRSFEFLKFQLTDSEFHSLVSEFGERGEVSYRKFCHSVEEIFSNRNLENQPNGQTMDSREVILRTQNQSEASDDQQFTNLLVKLAQQVATRGVHIRESFIDFDPHNNGRITQGQFFRAFPFRDLSASEMQLLVNRYSDPILRDVNYKRLHMDVNEYLLKGPGSEGGSARLLPHQLQSIHAKQAIAPSDALLSQFAAHIREQRIRFREFFQSKDPLAIGLIAPENFE